jgi:hypothetical protein
MTRIIGHFRAVESIHFNTPNLQRVETHINELRQNLADTGGPEALRSYDEMVAREFATLCQLFLLRQEMRRHYAAAQAGQHHHHADGASAPSGKFDFIE